MKRACSTALAVGLLLSSVLGGTIAHAQTGKTIVIGMGQEPDRLLKLTMFVSQLVSNLTYDQLVNTDDRMQPFAQLAAEVPSFENGLAQLVGDGGDRHLEVTFPLRQGVTWSDGTPFTADDVVYFFNFIMNPASGWDTSMEEKIKSVDKIDDYTARFTWLSANEARALDPTKYANQGTDPVIDPLYFFGFNIDGMGVYPAHKLRQIVGDDPRHATNIMDYENSDLSRNPVGTGPYTLTSWEPGVALTLQSRGVKLPQRFAGTGPGGAPAVDTIVFRIIPSKDTNLAALQAGEIQMITSDVLDVGDSQTLDSMPGVAAQYVPGTTWEHLTLNLDNPILADRNVRQAIAYGLNRQELVDIILYGKSEPMASQIPSWSWAFNADVPRYQYDPAKADELLTDSGWVKGADGIRVKNGQRLSLKYWSTSSAFRPRNLPLVKDQLQQIGIEMNVEFVPSSVYFDAKATSPQAISARQFDVVEFAWVGGYDPGADAMITNHSKNIPTRENGYRGNNYAGFRHGYNDLLLEQGATSLDNSFRRIAYGAAQNIWMTELPIIPLFLRPVTGVATTALQNYRVSMNSVGETWNVEQWDLAR